MFGQKSKPTSTSNNQLIEWKKHKFYYLASIQLEEQGLVKKSLPESHQSLNLALSDALFFCTNYAEWVQKMCIEELKNIVQDTSIINHPRLAFLYGNFNIVKDYSSQSQLPGFEKLTLELVSRIFQRRIIVYYVSDDHFLNSYVIDKNYSKEIGILKTPNYHYDTVYNKQYIDAAGFCQNIIFNLMENVINKEQQVTKQNYTKDTYVNLELFHIESVLNGQYLKQMCDQGDNTAQFIGNQTQKSQAKSYGNTPSKQQNVSNFTFTENPQIFESDKLEVQVERPQYILRIINNKIYDMNKSPVYYVNQLPPGLNQQDNQKTLQAQSRISSQENIKQISQVTTEASIKDIPEIINKQGNITQQNKPQRLLQTQMSLPLDIGSSTNSNATRPFQMIERKKTIVLEESKQRYQGTLKFFDDIKNYGFIVMEEDGSDIFLHYDDLIKANIPKEFLKDDKKTKPLKFSFLCMNYIGRYDKSRKAIDLQLIDS